MPMLRLVDQVTASNGLWWVARILLVVVFVLSGLAKLIDFNGGMEEMQNAGLEPAALFNIAVALTLLAGSLLILLDRFLWLGAGALATFLLLTILVVHRFWSLPEPQATLSMYFAFEHISLIGGLVTAAIASHFRKQYLVLEKETCGKGVK